MSEIEQLRDENRRLREACEECLKASWHSEAFVRQSWRNKIRQALAQPAVVPAQQPEPAKDRLREMTDEEADALIERVEDAVGMDKGAWDMTPGRELARSFAAALAASKGEVQHG